MTWEPEGDADDWHDWDWWQWMLAGEAFATIDDIAHTCGPEYLMYYTLDHTL